jgi:prefoldin subunit 5
MPKDWEEMTASERLSSLRSEVDSLNRVTESVARRIEEIRNELKVIESAVSSRKDDRGVS